MLNVKVGLFLLMREIWRSFYDDIEGAFLAYKQAKEDYIKEVANKYKDVIEDKVYEILMRYEVNIDD